MMKNIRLLAELMHGLQDAIDAEASHRTGLATAKRNREDLTRQLTNLIGADALARLLGENEHV